MKHFILFLLFSLALAGCATTQWATAESSGTVIDADSDGAPLQGVAVVRVFEGKSVRVATTDAEGKFTVPPLKVTRTNAGGDSSTQPKLVFSKPGYEKNSIEIGPPSKSPSYTSSLIALRKQTKPQK